MLIMKNFFYRVNIFEECKSLRLSIWQCPPFLFILMGVVNVSGMLGSYLIASRLIIDESAVVLVVVGVSLSIFIIGNFLISGFNKMADADRMKNEFISVVSHQLRTPLAALKWSSELLLRPSHISSLNEDDKSYLVLLRENAERMIKLVSLLLEANRIESDHATLQRKAFDLVDVTKGVIESVTAYAGAYELVLKLEAFPSIPQALGDPEKIKLVVLALIDNAVRYSHKKSDVIVKIEVMRNHVRWQVTDSGVGIPVSQQKFIFKKFFRSDNARKYQTEGSGLGLYIAKAVVEELGGRIGFVSEENKGSVFWFTLPMSK
ncbi:MAG: hypothetical protein A3B29_04205 [Candidatus Sungbacteria bacterium RIFCSPLOWO2_01_FULL_51_34]|nr:MAG: hypothetical protein A3B29_04205 [Candidatus Sungbacteria bacterium RIFCSPLOWO2_01_FULL_51_34]